MLKNREQQLEHVLRELVATIDLFTDCMDGRLERSMLDLYIENAEALLTTGLDDIAPIHFLGEWKDASKDFPDADMTVLVCTRNCAEPVWLGYYDGLNWFDLENLPIEVTHWADMPEPVMSAEIKP